MISEMARNKPIPVYAENAIRDLPEYDEVRTGYANLQWIEDYQTFRRDKIRQEKDSLIFARKRGVWLKPFHCYSDPQYQYLSLGLAEGCPFDCVYCYLQSYLNHGALVLFLGRESLHTEMQRLPQEQFWISTGLLSDSLIAEKFFPVLPYLSRWIPENSVLELRSKDADVNCLSAEEIVNRKRIVISWSLNPDSIASTYEYGTVHPQARMDAAMEVVRLGYRIAFHFDPVFYYDDWQRDYGLLIADLKRFQPGDIAFLSVGLFRYMPGLGKIIRQRFPFHPILSGEFFPDSDGKYHYWREIRKEMYNAFQRWLRPWGQNVPIFWSMEPDPKLIY